MIRATVIIESSQPDEVATWNAWLERSGSSLARISQNYGCGCCLYIHDIEGPQESIDTLPKDWLFETDWVKYGIAFGAGEKA
jgi:hypothetical protein